MRIAVSDNNNRKFITDLLARWGKDGHKVFFELGTNPSLFKSCDVYFIDSCDHNAKVAAVARKYNCRLFVRVLDIEAWVKHPASVKWENVDGVIFINQRIKKLVESYTDLSRTRVKVIKCGIDLNKFTLKKSFQGRKIALVVGQHRIYNDKRIDEAVKILAELNKRSRGFTLHILGTESNQAYYIKYLHSLIDSLNLREAVEFVDYVDDVNSWLEDKTYIITPGIKEAFSFATAEAMAKGIKPVINNFWGAQDIWDKKWIYNTHSEAVEMFLSEITPMEYRRYIDLNYNFERFYREMNEFMGIR